MTYKNLLSTGRIGPLEIKNRLVMPAMSETLTDKYGQYMEDERAYYEERAKGGTGLIITSFCAVDPKGLGAPNQLGAYDITQVVGLKKISDSVHRHNGRIFLQLHHAGRCASSDVIGQQPSGPSAIPCPLDFGGTLEMPRAMTTEEVKEMVNKFVFAAKIAKMSNFDGVELHSAHSYLLNQFISPLSNQRTDEYGGNTENRVRIIKEIIMGIKEICGPNFPISVRMSANDGIEGGVDIEEAKKIAVLLEQYGVHLINVSAGGYEATQLCIPTAGFEEGLNVYLAKEIKKVVNIPVAIVGMIRDYNHANDIIKNNDADFICMGRPHIADPYIVNKLQSGREKEIRQCITCMHCVESADEGRMACSINPVLGYEKDFKKFHKNGNDRTVVIVGGGPSGCEAARVLAIRGFKVVLMEKKDKLGGQVNLAAVPPNKDRMGLLSEYYTNVLEKLGVEILYNTNATLETIKVYDPYAVFVATGSGPIVPPIPGVNNENVCTAESVLEGTVKIEDKKVVVVGSGNTGIETAELLQENNNEVTLADMLPEIGMLASASGSYSLADVMKAGVETLSGHRLSSIEGNNVKFIRLEDEEEITTEFDYVVLSLGVRKIDTLLGELSEEVEIIKAIGDTYQTGNIATSVKSAFYAAYYLDDESEEIV